jgi:virginiamycin B lyase
VGLLVVAVFGLVGAPTASATAPAIVQYSSGISAGSSPNTIAPGPDGAMWFTEYNGTIGRVAVDGTITEYPTSGPSLTAGAHPSGIVAANGELWFTEFGVGQIGEIDPASGQLIGEFTVPSGPGSEPQGITAGPDGALWFTEAGTGLLGRLDTSAVQPGTSDGITEYDTKYTDHPSATDQPVQLVSEGGYLWVTLAGLGGGLDRLDPSSAEPGTDDGFGFYPMPTTNSGPEGITVDPGTGDLWVSEYAVGKVVNVDPGAVVVNTTTGMSETATPGFSPLLGTPGHDGQLWFTGPTNGDKLLQLDPSSPSTQGPVTAGITGAPNADATDAAGDVWFTEFVAGAVGVVQLAAAPTAGNPTIAPAQPLQDQLETCDPDAADWTGSPVFTYQWLLDGNAIPGATGSSYTPVAGDVGHQLSCQVTGTNGSGAMNTPSGAAAIDAPALIPGVPTITGTAQAGQTLTCDPDAIDWTGSPASFTYQWLRDGAQIAGAIGTTYLLTDLDAGHAVTCPACPATT